MDSAPLPFHPLRSSWLAGWTYAGGKLTIRLVRGGELEVEVPSWMPGLLSASKSPGSFVKRHVMPLGLRSIPPLAPACPNGCGPTVRHDGGLICDRCSWFGDDEPDLTPALEASIELERSRRDPFSLAVDSYTRQFLAIAASQTARLDALSREVAP